MALVLGDERVDQLAPMGPERGERLSLIGADQSRIAGDVCGDDGGEAALGRADWDPPASANCTGGSVADPGSAASVRNSR
jgi:hypothetical protein